MMSECECAPFKERPFQGPSGAKVHPSAESNAGQPDQPTLGPLAVSHKLRASRLGAKDDRVRPPTPPPASRLPPAACRLAACCGHQWLG